MPVDVDIWLVRANVRARRMCEELNKGVAAAGDRPTVRQAASYRGPIAQVCAFYGYEGGSPQIMSDYLESGRTVVFVDLGYWKRREGGRFAGYHKVAVNARHPTKYFRGKPQDHTRIRGMESSIRKWRKYGQHILLAGMSRKAAESVGLQAEEWERRTIEKLKQVTDRKIIYRPKPSWVEARPLAGTIYSPARQSLETVLNNCHAVVTRHSNVGLDAMLAGVPVFAEDGVASVMGKSDLNEIESPVFPDDRLQWLADVSWTQFNARELRTGVAWRHLKSQGLVP